MNSSAFSHSNRHKLSVIRSQRIITNKRDMVRRTWLKFHPSLGESDQVVWAYTLVRDEYENKLYTKQLGRFILDNLWECLS
jgi:hypothetical protein